MAELTHDTAEDGFHEIQLSGKQLVFLFMATTVVLVVSFLCGVLVGRGVRAERGEQPVDTAMVDSAAAPATTPDAPAAPPAPVAEPDLTYHERLQQPATTEKLGQKPVEQPAPAKPVSQPAAKPEPAAPAPAGANVPTTGRPGTWFLQVTALRNRAAAADLVRSLIAKGYPAYLENPASGAPPIYRVRIGRYANRDEADQVARRLQKEEQFTSDIRR